MWRRSRLSLGEVYAALKRLRRCAQTHIAPLGDWMLRGTRTHREDGNRARAAEGSGQSAAELQSASFSPSAGSGATGELPS